MGNIGFNINKFVKGSDECNNHSVDKLPATTEENKPKKGKSKKNSNQLPAVNESSDKPLSYLQSNESYITAYTETNKQLDAAINELNTLGAEIVSELMHVKSSKTMKNKYGVINEMTATASNIIGTKIQAIKEKNKSINDANNMDLRRMKDLKMNESNESDNQKIMNLYDAFINTPVGINGGTASLGPSISSMTINGGLPDINTVSLSNSVVDGAAQQNWETSLSPAENRMLLESQGKIETVVFYDEVTGNRWYEVVDKITKQPVPNVEKPADTFIYELDINTRGGFAKDINRNVTYPLVIINNGDSSITEY